VGFRKENDMKKWLYAIALLAFLAILIELMTSPFILKMLARVKPVSAQSSNIKLEQINPTLDASETATPVPGNATENPEVNEITPSATETIQNTESPIELLEGFHVKAINGLKLTLETLYEKQDNGEKSAWIHTREEIVYDTDEENLRAFPNGIIIPKEQKNDFWRHLDADGKIFEAIFIQRSFDGIIGQVAIQYNGKCWENATGSITNCGNGILETIISDNFLKEVKWLLSFDIQPQPTRRVTLPNGNEGIEIIIGSKHEPENPIEFKKPVVEDYYKGRFDIKTGYMVEQEHIVTFEDGSTRIFEHITLEITFESPNYEALKYFEEGKKELTK
jgi:hypothetical protein